MKEIGILILALCFWVGGTAAYGEETSPPSSSGGDQPAAQPSSESSSAPKFRSTGEGDQTLSTGYSPSDPLGNRPVNKYWDAGHPATQQPYDENCREDRCIRAEKRQTGTTTWQEDRASGLSK